MIYLRFHLSARGTRRRVAELSRPTSPVDKLRQTPALAFVRRYHGNNWRLRKCSVNASVLKAASLARISVQKRWWFPKGVAPGYAARQRWRRYASLRTEQIGHKSEPCASARPSAACLLQPLHCSPPRASRPERACRRAHCSPRRARRPEDARDDTCLQPEATHRHSKRIPC